MFSTSRAFFIFFSGLEKVNLNDCSSSLISWVFMGQLFENSPQAIARVEGYCSRENGFESVDLSMLWSWRINPLRANADGAPPSTRDNKATRYSTQLKFQLLLLRTSGRISSTERRRRFSQSSELSRGVRRCGIIRFLSSTTYTNRIFQNAAIDNTNRKYCLETRSNSCQPGVE